MGLILGPEVGYLDSGFFMLFLSPRGGFCDSATTYSKTTFFHIRPSSLFINIVPFDLL